MSVFGLTQEKVVEILTAKGIRAGERSSAAKLREAIAEVIAENNREIEKRIPEIAVREIINELRRSGMIKR